MASRSKKTPKMTPVMQQFHAAKQAYPDAILFFRLGDFYEMFYEDAKTASRLLDLTLTSRNRGALNEVPMAGIPYHAAHSYIGRLLAAGHKVALCEQMADPSKVKGIVPREVVRVITPGLVIDQDQLEPRSNHYLCVVDEHRAQLGVALLDLSTGELLAADVADSPANVMAEVARAQPAEILLAPQIEALSSDIQQVAPQAALRMDAPLDVDTALPIVEEVIGAEMARDAVDSLSSCALLAAGRALRFAQACQPGKQLPVRRIVPFEPSDVLQIDDIAQQHLELVRSADGARKGSLLHVIDKTRTAFGGRLLRKWLLTPLQNVSQIAQRQDAVEALVVNPSVREQVRSLLQQVGDLERLAVRVLLGEAGPRDLGVIRDSLLVAPDVLDTLRQIKATDDSDVLGVHKNPPDTVEQLCDLLTRGLVDSPPTLARDGGIFRDGFDEVLDETGRLQREGADLMVALEADLRASTGIASLKVRYTRVFGWYIEVTKTHLSKVPGGWRRKQTVAGKERYTNEALDDLADRLTHAEEQHASREAELFADLLRRVAEDAERLRSLGARFAQWDVFAALAQVAHELDYVRPLVDRSQIIDLRESRHPVVEQLAASGRFVPNDVVLDTAKERFWLVTGPNMAGKSTLMRQVALVVILAQMGSFVPARMARVGVVDRILSRVGANDNVTKGESTFMVEMRETSSILRHATRRSLVILDEIGRGTSTYDGLSIAWAVAEHLHDAVGCRALFATHYHELTEFAENAKHTANYAVSAREQGDDVVFLYKLLKGAASRSYGVAVARLAGLPEPVLARAKAILHALEAGEPLPGGRYAFLRGRNRAGGVQMDLFAPAKSQQALPSEVEETLRALDPERLTPLQALQLVIKLKELADGTAANS